MFTKGHSVPDAWRKKISGAHRGRIVSKEWREHIAAALRGRKHPIEQTLKQAKSRFRHGEGSLNSPEYRSWYSMKQRCTNKNAANWKNYGGRGIKFCKEWDNYLTFLKDMGRKPGKEYSLDRIDNNGDYCKENCKWSTRLEQNRNRRDNIIFNGETASEASRRLGGEVHLVTSRLRNGMPLELAFTLPIKLALR